METYHDKETGITYHGLSKEEQPPEGFELIGSSSVENTPIVLLWYKNPSSPLVSYYRELFSRQIKKQ